MSFPQTKEYPIPGSKKNRHDQSRTGLKDLRGLPKKTGNGGHGNWEDLKGEIQDGMADAARADLQSHTYSKLSVIEDDETEWQ
ncbi:hypothetical protein HDV03_001750 [Kappamyces sp. JEL0829]|nr:hypothetical protein HDV03_001750 [Kappamyces sp. JEL0829]